MIQVEALFKISYGLYLVCSGDSGKGNAYVSNTVFQVTSDPPRFATCCNKDNHTADLIRKTGSFSVSVLHSKVAQSIISLFGYRSGKDTDKMKDVEVRYGITGVPVVLTDSIAVFEFKAEETIDLGTHWMFIGEMLHAEVLNEDIEPMTYDLYRRERKAAAPKNAPTYIDKSKYQKKEEGDLFKKYKCVICGHIYDDRVEKVKFADLPDDWRCPVCGADREEFEEV